MVTCWVVFGVLVGRTNERTNTWGRSGAFGVFGVFGGVRDVRGCSGCSVKKRPKG